ncbi:MAG TPA: diguanylate cyclase [bacterium]|nr:diguanylate cyclase [bacterium]
MATDRERSPASSVRLGLDRPGPSRPVPAKLRVLIVEDQPADAELVVRELRRAGYIFEWERVDTEAAYRKHLTPLPNLILSDYSLPGFGAARALEVLQEGGLDLPFIIISGMMGEEAAVTLMRSGATDYLLKDRLTRLGQAVGWALEAHGLRQDKRKAEEDLRVSEARYRTLFEGVPVGLYRTTPDGKILETNPAFLRILGYPDHGALMSTGAVSLYVDPEHRKRWLALLETEGAVTDFESQLRRHDGKLIWVRAGARVVRDPAGRSLYVEGAIIDVTERKHAEDEVHRRAAHLETLNTIIAASGAAQDEPALLETTVDAILKALGCEMGGVWTERTNLVRGMAPEAGSAIPGAMEAAGYTLLGPQAVDDWQSLTGLEIDALAPVMGRFGIRASITAPIRTDGRILGGIAVGSTVSRRWLSDEVMLVEAVGTQISEAVERLMLSQETQRRTVELQAFYELSRQLREAPSVDEMYPMIVEHAMTLLAGAHGSLALLNTEREGFTRVYTVGIPTEKMGSTFPVSETRSGEVVRTGTAYVSADFSNEQTPAWLSGSPYRLLGPFAIVPMRSEEEITGTLCLARPKAPESRPFTEADIRLLEGIAEIGGTAIRRARLNHHLEQSYIEMVLVLARAADARDSYTADHSERIATRAVALARAMGCGEIDVQNVQWGALLHDIGKLGVPDNILRKPGPLTEAEWHVMRQHPAIGEEILRPVDRMREVAALVRHHQERWDGTGYPDHLRGEEIPLGARILAVADTYGAMTDDRSYGRGRTTDEALAEIGRCAGTQFDPRVVDAFCRMLTEGGEEARLPFDREPDAGKSAVRPSETAIARSLSHARRIGRVVPAMTDVAKRLLRPLDLTAVLDEILSQIREVFGYPLCSVFFINEQTGELHLAARRGGDPAAAPTATIGEQAIAKWVVDHGRPYYASDVVQDPMHVAGPPGVRSQVAFPLIVNDRVIGVLHVESPLVDAFPKELRELLEAFVFLAALAILRAQRDEGLSRLALTDGLTGLANHRALWDALEREVARARRSASPVSVAIVEVDKFKQVNDGFGHLQGDQVLKLVADAMRKTSRAMDLVARSGGDEFVLLLPDLPKRSAVQIAERVRRHVEEIFVSGGPRLTVSVGLASMPEDGETANALMEAADRAMYTVKHSGGNRVSVA